MAMRLDYVIRETTNNLLRNLLLTVASIITFGVSLGILGGALLFVAGVDHAFERWKDGVEFIVYMQPGADQEKIDQVEGKLAASPQVADISFVDTEKTFEEFQQLFRDDPDRSTGSWVLRTLGVGLATVALQPVAGLPAVVKM